MSFCVSLDRRGWVPWGSDVGRHAMGLAVATVCGLAANRATEPLVASKEKIGGFPRLLEHSGIDHLSKNKCITEP
eukprot:5851913-Amphidinium_carterae.1